MEEPLYDSIAGCNCRYGLFHDKVFLTELVTLRLLSAEPVRNGAKAKAEFVQHLDDVFDGFLERPGNLDCELGAQVVSSGSKPERMRLR